MKFRHLEKSVLDAIQLGNGKDDPSDTPPDVDDEDSESDEEGNNDIVPAPGPQITAATEFEVDPDIDNPPNTRVHIWCAIRRHCAVVKSAQHLGTLGNNPKDN